MFRFVHAADVHLDTRYRSRDEDSRRRLVRSAELAFERAVDLCLQQRVHALLVAGDLFDHDRLSFHSESFLRRQLGRLAEVGIPSVLVSGNHDPGFATRDTRADSWPSGVVRIGSADPQTVQVRDPASGRLVGRVTGAGHASAQESDNLARRFPAPRLDVPHVAVLHTMVAGSRAREQHDRYAPCGLEDLRAHPFSYWALGHIHLRQQVCEEPVAWYSGNLQGRNPRETGSKGVLLVEVSRDSREANVIFHPLARARFETIRLGDLSAVRHPSDLIAPAVKELEAITIADPGCSEHDWHLRISLEGVTPLADHLPSPFLQREELLAQWQEELTAELGASEVRLDVQGIRRPLDLERHRDQPHLFGEALRFLERLRGADETEFAKLVQEFVPDSLAGMDPRECSDRDNYIRGLLDGLDEELADRMLEDGG